MLTQEWKDKIREELPHGYQTKIAKAAGVNPLYVNLYLSGVIKCSKIEKVVVDEYYNYKQEVKAILSNVEHYLINQ